MEHPPQAELVRTFSIEPFGGSIVRLGDIDGDGEQEMLILQSPGQFKSALYVDRDDIGEEDQHLHCLTALTLDGRVLWQDGEPWQREMPYTGHGGARSVRVADVDADGSPEVVVMRRDEVVVLDGATGREKATRTMPADNYLNVYTAQFGPPEEGRQILCKVNDRAYEPWDYANPTVVYNPDLSVYRGPFAVRGAGHNMVPMDVDGDGRDELFLGYSLLDSQLNEVWRLDLGEDFDYVADHADQIEVSDLNDDGRPEVLYSGSEDFYVADMDGNLLWQTQAGHSQRAVEGPWGPDGEKRVIMSEKNRGLWGLDADGKVLWNRTDINGYAVGRVRWRRGDGRSTWALFRPQLRPIHPTPYESDPSGSRDLWPRFIDGDGTLLDVFPWEDEYEQPRRRIRAARSYDCGVRYGTVVSDIDADGLDEVIVHDRRRVWIFRSPA